MGKRKRDNRDSDSDLDEYIERKLKKLSKKFMKRKNKERERVSEQRNKDLTQIQDTRDYEADINPDLETLSIQREYDSEETIVEEPIPSTSANPLPIPDSVENTLQQNDQDPIEPPVSDPIELNTEIMNILGDDPSKVEEYGKEIQAELAVRFQHLVANGLPKEARKELQDKYLPPSNCTIIDAPALNPEIKAAVSDVVLKRDKGIEFKQKELCSAISCVGEALTILFSKEDKDTSVIQLLMDAARLMCDCQNADSVTRRNFVLYNVKKDMKDQLQKSKIDKNLFGSDLAETLKTAKLISKSGAELKSAPVPAAQSAAKNKPLPGTSTQQSRNNLNWKAPPPSRRQKGIQRTREPAQRSRHTSSSRPSYYRAPQSSRSRH